MPAKKTYSDVNTQEFLKDCKSMTRAELSAKYNISKYAVGKMAKAEGFSKVAYKDQLSKDIAEHYMKSANSTMWSMKDLAGIYDVSEGAVRYAVKKYGGREKSQSRESSPSGLEIIMPGAESKDEPGWMRKVGSTILNYTTGIATAGLIGLLAAGIYMNSGHARPNPALENKTRQEQVAVVAKAPEPVKVAGYTVDADNSKLTPALKDHIKRIEDFANKEAEKKKPEPKAEKAPEIKLAYVAPVVQIQETKSEPEIEPAPVVQIQETKSEPKQEQKIEPDTKAEELFKKIGIEPSEAVILYDRAGDDEKASAKAEERPELGLLGYYDSLGILGMQATAIRDSYFAAADYSRGEKDGMALEVGKNDLLGIIDGSLSGEAYGENSVLGASLRKRWGKTSVGVSGIVGDARGLQGEIKAVLYNGKKLNLEGKINRYSLSSGNAKASGIIVGLEGDYPITDNWSAVGAVEVNTDDKLTGEHVRATGGIRYNFGSPKSKTLGAIGRINLSEMQNGLIKPAKVEPAEPENPVEPGQNGNGNGNRSTQTTTTQSTTDSTPAGPVAPPVTPPTGPQGGDNDGGPVGY